MTAPSAADDCGCCGRVEDEPLRNNPPGLAALPYRSGTQVTVLRRMLAGLSTALPAHTARAPDDPGVALLDAWATVADVVTFYQERILNEGFLRTATERRSVLELARAIGYELRPGVAAATDLAFTVGAVPGAPTEAAVAERTAVQSVPGQGERSQTFETGTPLVARADLDAVGLRLRGPQLVEAGTTGLYLSGVTTGLAAGDAILVVRRGAEPAADDQRELRVLRTVVSQPAPPDGLPTTEVTWDDGLAAAAPGHDTVEVFALRQRASLFGATAPDFRVLPEEIRKRYSGTTTDPPASADWPGFPLPDTAARPVLDLDAAYPAVGSGSWLVLSQPGVADGVYSVVEAELAAVANFGITARTTRVTLDRVAGLAGFTRREAVVRTQSALLTLADSPLLDEVTGPQVETERSVPLPEGAPVFVTGATATGEAVVLRTTVTGVDGATLTLDPPLPALLRDSVRVLGNVVAATHGETVDDEVLGSGDGTATFQRFTLRRPPLTHLAAPTTSGVAGTLEVRVDGVAWTQVPSLFLAGPHDRVYVVRIDDDARATVVFGDGERGARLPTGQENVRARYRTGIGPEGDVPAGALSLLPQRPFGISTVTNPRPALGGVGPETLDDARVNAPLTVLTLDRVVSVCDHEDFARAFIGVAKARAVALRIGNTLLVHLTVAAADGGEVAPTTVTALRDAIVALGGDADRLRVDSVLPAPFAVGVAVLADPARVRSDVDDAVRASLRATFAAGPRSFGQPVSAAEVLAAAAAVPGVVAATVTALHRAGGTGVEEVLVAHDARFSPTAADEEAVPTEPAEPDRILPAELLVIDPDGIEVTEMAP